MDGGGVPGDRDVSFIVTAKEVTESCTSTVGALAFNQIKPSGTLGYRIVKRLFDLVFSLMAIAILFIPVGLVCVLICLESPGSPLYTQERLQKMARSKIFKLRAWLPMLAMFRSI